MPKGQHFLLSAAARTLSLSAVARMSDEEARAAFKAVRWADNGGEPYCPQCGSLAIYGYAARPIFKCKDCGHQFSYTSGTIFADRKRPLRDYLLAIAIFANGAKGHSALQLSRDLDCQYKTAFVLAHKLREAMQAEQDKLRLAGVVEIDGLYTGGHIRPMNKADERIDRRLPEMQTGKRQSVVAIRERGGQHRHGRGAEGKRGRADDPRARRDGLGNACRRSERMGHAARPLRHAPRQPFDRVQHERGLHQSGGILFLARAPRRDGHPS